ncbi:DUF2267 domain-containing protein [Tepidamorphus sp. 3E244]|uniref:DUF2267 domain-containing protein n=1 Tax=Tepidamorphus sp. 3E244 TaxID=3385498 RepID=UPI0038FC447A
MMQDLVQRIVSNVGVTEQQAEKSIEIILGFLKQAGPRDKVNELFEKLPGSVEAAGEDAGGGMFGGGMMAAMGAMGQMQAAGLGMGEVQSVTREVVDYAREHAGDDLVNEIIRSIPGISQFV